MLGIVADLLKLPDEPLTDTFVATIEGLRALVPMAVRIRLRPFGLADQSPQSGHSVSSRARLRRARTKSHLQNERAAESGVGRLAHSAAPLRAQYSVEGSVS